MPKLKTHSGARKRFKVTGKGKLKFRRCERNHNLGKKAPKVKRQSRPNNHLKPCDAPGVHRLIIGT